MKNLEQHLSEYAAYHRDKRNIYTHYAGIPLIVFALLCFLSKPASVYMLPVVGELTASPAWILWLFGNIFYIALDRRLGLAMAVITAFMAYAAQFVALLAFGPWLAVSTAIFIGGWVLQFIGHYYEGKKPAFVDDLMGLAIGPLFVLVEISFDLGLRTHLKHEIEKRVGPVKA